MDSRQRELEDIKYEYDKALRYRDNLQKNLDRRKKLNLVDEGYESDIKSEIAAATDNLAVMKAKLRKIESEVARSRVISDTNERSPWEK